MIEITVSGTHARSDILNEYIEKGITEACLAIEAEARERCPVKTGELRRSITHEVKTEGDVIEGKVGSNLDYAPYIHEGTGIYSRSGSGRKDVPWVYFDGTEFHTTSGIRPTPFLEDAVNVIAPQILDYFRGD